MTGAAPALLAAAFAAGAALLVAAALGLAAVSRGEARARARLAAVRPGGAPASLSGRDGGGGAVAGLLRGLAALGHRLARSGVLSPKTLGELERTVASAGLRGGNSVAVFVGAKIVGFPAGIALGAAAGALLGGASGVPPTLFVALGGAVGLLAPDAVARRLRKRHLALLERGLPDALDLLVICAEGGLSLEASVERVAEEIRGANAAVAEEFALCAKELSLLADRRQALLNMADRAGLAGLRRVAAALAQSLRYGTPLSQALRTLAAELRDEQATRFEERAARLPSALTVPMIVCILPTLFLVVGGPAALQALALR